MKNSSVFSLLIVTVAGIVSVLFADDAEQQIRLMTRYEKAMQQTSDIYLLENMWDTLSTEYDRRFFLNGLPGYCRDKQVTELPEWITNAVKKSLKSKDPMLVYEAISVAGKLHLECGNELVTLFPKISSTFGCHTDMLKSTLIASLETIDYASKDEFYYKVLENDDINILSAEFESLLDVIESSPKKKYARKLAEHLASVQNFILRTKIVDEAEDAKVKRIRDIGAKIEKAYLKAESGELR